MTDIDVNVAIFDIPYVRNASSLIKLQAWQAIIKHQEPTEDCSFQVIKACVAVVAQSYTREETRDIAALRCYPLRKKNEIIVFDLGGKLFKNF